MILSKSNYDLKFMMILPEFVQKDVLVRFKGTCYSQNLRVFLKNLNINNHEFGVKIESKPWSGTLKTLSEELFHLELDQKVV